MRTVQKFIQDEQGPTSVEYAVMLALILMSCVVTIKALGSSTSGLWATNQQRLEEVGFNQPATNETTAE